MKTILVSGASGIVGYGILRSLRNIDGYCKLIGTTIYEDSVAPAFCDVFEKAISSNEPNYIDWLCNIIKKHNIDIIIPGIEVDMYKWLEEYDRLMETGAYILLNNPSLISLCEDKWKFYNTLNRSMPELSIPSTISGSYEELAEKFQLPFIMKPRKGYGSKGIIRINSEDEFMKVGCNFGSKLLAQPIIGTDDEEFTVSAFFDSKSKLCCCISLKRRLSRDGYTEKAQVTEINGINQILMKLSAVFKPIGPTNFQFRIEKNQLKLLEINPRISSATSIRTAFGYNEAKMSVDYFLLGIEQKQPVIRDGTAIRYIEESVFYDRNYF